VRIPIKATAREPINRPDTYQRLPTARPHLRTAAGPYIRGMKTSSRRHGWAAAVRSVKGPSAGATVTSETRRFRPFERRRSVGSSRPSADVGEREAAVPGL